MKNHHALCVGIAVVMFLSGCVAHLSFNNRPNFETIVAARNIQITKKTPIAVRWLPPDFPEMRESVRAGGYTVMTPTGVNLANRIVEVLDASVGVNNTSGSVLRVAPFVAESKLEFSTNNVKYSRTIIAASCSFEAEFILDRVAWTDKFFSTRSLPEESISSQTEVLERVWDDIALQVAKNF